VIFILPVLLPWGEVAEFSIVAIVGKPHLRSNKQNLSIVNDYSAVIYDILVDDRP
jgi:hypothetical protein